MTQPPRLKRVGQLLLSDEDELVFEAFSREAAELDSKNLWEQKDVLSWSWGPGGFQHHMVDDDWIVAFLASVRKFHLKKDEKIYFPSVAKRLKRRLLNSSKLSAEIDKTRDVYRRGLEEGRRAIRIVRDGKWIRPHELLDHYFNGKYFHADVDKRRAIEELEKGDLVPRIAMLEAAFWVASCILRLAELITEAKKD